MTTPKALFNNLAARRGGVVHGFGFAVSIVLLILILVPCSAALAAAGGTGWKVISLAKGPSNLPPGGTGYIELHIYNVGEAPSSGKITVTDNLPSGVTFTGAQPTRAFGYGAEPWECSGGSLVTCTSTATIEGGVPAQLDLQVSVASGLSGVLTNMVTVGGGGAATTIARANDPLTVSANPTSFGVQDFEVWASNADGTIDTQAGSHPYELTTAFDVNSRAEQGEQGTVSAGEFEDVTVKLPPGIIGDPNAAPQCPRKIFDLESCPGSTQIGVDVPYLGQNYQVRTPVFNLVPPAGMPAQFGFNIGGVNTFLDASVRSGGDYGITEHVDHVAQRQITFNTLTIWGVPSDPSHDLERCTIIARSTVCDQPGDDYLAATSLLTMPTSCTEELDSSIEMNSWEDESDVSSLTTPYSDNEDTPTGLGDCQHLSLNPTITVAPDTTHADTPAGLTVDVHVPQEGLLQGKGLSPADLQNTRVTLPQGLAINPGQAAGLQACGPTEDGLTTPLEKEHGEEDNGSPSCPNASKVGTVTIHSPLIEAAAEKQFEGNVYVLQSNPPEIKLLVAASADGVNLKLVGVVHLDEQTGQLVTTFEGTPQLPFTDFKLTFSGGPQAALATPAACGTYGTNADFMPWSSPFSADALTGSTFLIDAPAAGASSCTGPLPFSPSLTAGATTDQAGGFTDFSMLLQRGDDQQRIEKLSFKAPAGLSGMLASVPLCDEADANAGTCPAASHIGHAVVSSGPGPYPLVLPQPGDPELAIYLTGPYHGAPFGLSIVTPVLAGPFNLGTVVTRAKIEVDPTTAQITVTTDALPQVIEGVPTDLRSVDAVIDRPGFMFNPTNCNPQEFTGTATGTPPPGVGGGDTTAAIGSHFQVGSCRQLEFAPKFSVSTSGKTSKANGASLTAKVTYPNAAQGTQSNIALTKVELPKQLPSRLTTLQKACLAKVFEANPAACPKESFIGTATVHTPVLPVPLTGPVVFVSHGGEAFPSLTVVLQGDNVTIDLVGATFISKAGITSTTFKTVPDAPFSSFELTLPEGKYSALAANLPAKAKGSFCGQSLVLPVEFIGQNGALVKRSAPVAVEGCSTSVALVSHTVKKRTLTLSVYAPAAGKITAAGKGLTTQTKTAKGQEDLTLTLQQKRAGKLKTTAKITYTPNTGKDRKKQTKNTKLTFKK